MVTKVRILAAARSCLFAPSCLLLTLSLARAARKAATVNTASHGHPTGPESGREKAGCRARFWSVRRYHGEYLGRAHRALWTGMARKPDAEMPMASPTDDMAMENSRFSGATCFDMQKYVLT